MRNIFVGIVMGVFVAMASSSFSANTNTYRQLDLFGNVYERIHSDYVSEVEDEELVEAAINGMLTSLDPHSSYLNPDSFEDVRVQTRGEFGGLGIEVTMEEGVVKVVAPIDETPAARAGVQAGDFITALDGESIVGMTLDEAVDLMRGPKGSRIDLTILREGADEPLEISIIRDVIRVQSVRYRREGDVGYLRITTFNEQTESGLKKGIRALKKEIGSDLRGYVLDLRNNPGGLLDQAIGVSDIFLEEGAIVSTRGRNNRDSQRYSADKGDLTDEAPLIVLINGGSASASEIVAGALQDHRRATVLGTKSFGKGSVQTIIPLAGGVEGALKLTTAKYYTPSGRSIQAKGIEPDFRVEQVDPTKDEKPRRFTSEADLRNHLESDEEKAAREAKEKNQEEKGERPSVSAVMPEKEVPEDLLALEQPLDDSVEDYQLNRALEILNGIPLKTAAN